VLDTRRQKRQKLAFSFCQTNLAARRSQRFVHLGKLRPLGENHAVASGDSFDTVDNLVPWYCLRDETLRADPQSKADRLGPIRKAEYHDCAVAWIGT
jgi:hypothetical protein